MHQRQAKVTSIVLLLIVLVPLGYFVVEYLDHRAQRLAPTAEETQAVAQTEPLPTAPEERYVPPAPITYPFY